MKISTYKKFVYVFMVAVIVVSFCLGLVSLGSIGLVSLVYNTILQIKRGMANKGEETEGR